MTTYEPDDNPPQEGAPPIEFLGDLAEAQATLNSGPGDGTNQPTGHGLSGGRIHIEASADFLPPFDGKGGDIRHGSVQVVNLGTLAPARVQHVDAMTGEKRERVIRSIVAATFREQERLKQTSDRAGVLQRVLDEVAALETPNPWTVAIARAKENTIGANDRPALFFAVCMPNDFQAGFMLYPRTYRFPAPPFHGAPERWIWSFAEDVIAMFAYSHTRFEAESEPHGG